MQDTPEVWPALTHRVLWPGHVVTLSEDDIVSPSGEGLTREYVSHPGSVAVLALDHGHRIATVAQYRHPVGMRLIELPAGLLDVDREPPLVAAQRELAEEAGLAATDWRVLVDFCSSPGITDEIGRIYLARELTVVPRPAGFETHGEEVDMGLTWIGLTDALSGVRAGRLHNISLVLGVTSLSLAVRDGLVDALPLGDTPWPVFDRVRDLKVGRGRA